MDLILFYIMLLITIASQVYITVSYNKTKKIEASNNLSGFEVARKILDKNGLDLDIVETQGTLTDHYDPNRKVIRLSHDVFHGTSLAANAVAAHETGHAIQDKEGYLFLKIRSFIFPIVNLASKLSYFVILIGIFAQAFDFLYLGIGLLIICLLFEIVTLPVEINASKRALKELENMNIINTTDKSGIKNMLTAAALTYVASLVTSLLQIIRLLNLANRD